MSLSKAVVTGTISKKPEKRFTSNNLAITNIALDVSDNEEENLIKVVAVGKLAETAENFAKGSKIIVEGRLQTATVKSTSGEEKKIFEISAQNLEQMSAASPSQQSDETTDDTWLEEDDSVDELIGEDEIPF